MVYRHICFCTRGELSKYRALNLLDHYHQYGIITHHHPISDGGTPDITSCCEIMEELEICLKNNWKTLIHCYGGLGRSCLLAVASPYTVWHSITTGSHDSLRELRGSGAIQTIRSDEISCSVASDSLRRHESQHARPPCPSPTPGVHSDSRPLSQWCHPAISSSVVPFSCPQSLPASRSFLMSQLFAWGGQSVGVSASASVLPMNIQDWLPLRLTGWFFLQFRDSQESSPTPQFKSINSSALSFLYGPTLIFIHDYWNNHSFY